MATAQDLPAPAGVSVFIVEDAADLRFLYRLSLEAAGYEVVGEAATGARARLLAPAAEPDVVLVDLILPDVTGLELLPALRRAVPGARLIVCSGIEEPGTEDACRAAGADGFIKKLAASDIAAALAPLLKTA